MSFGELSSSLEELLQIDYFRGDHIVPSFEEIFPGLRGDDDLETCKRKKFIGDDYYENAMQVWQ